jgi:hypothetical protein
MAHQIRYNFNDQGYDYAKREPFTRQDIAAFRPRFSITTRGRGRQLPILNQGLNNIREQRHI